MISSGREKIQLETKIIISEISKIIKKNKVLDNISLEMHSGTVYGFQGINGSGKTMLMRAMIGLIHVTEGFISINGEILGKDIEFPKSIGFIIENPAFLDGYSGHDNLKFLTGINGKKSDEEIDAWLYKVGLGDAGKKKYKKYSLGMKQRLGIAAALIDQPDIVVLDEPTNALDDKGVAMLKALIMEERKRNALVIISCHDAAILRELSDTIIRLEEGRVVEIL